MQVDKSSQYYYGLDSTYRPTPSPAAQRPKPNISLDFYGVPTITRPMADIRGSKTPGSVEAAVDNAAAVSAFAKAAEFQKANNPPTPTVEPKAPVPPSTPATGTAKLDPNATKDYKAAFEGGQKNEEAIQQMYADRPDLQQWAKANPALAYKEFKKAGMAGKEPFAYNDVEFGKLESNPAEAAKKAGIEKLYEGQVEQTEQEKAAQAFKNFYVDGLKGLNVSQYKDMDENPSSVDPSTLLEKSVDFNIPGLAGTLGNYGPADYGELLKKYPNVFSNK